MDNKSYHPDIYGEALWDFIQDHEPQDIIVHCDVTEDDIYPTEVFFRNESAFPEIERYAMKLAKGKILDVGAGSGIHSQYLTGLGLDVHPIDISPKAVKVMKDMGLENARELDFFAMNREKYDTIIMLMNGFGIMGTLDRVPEFFAQAKNLLYPGGQILCDSSDLIYLYEQEDGSILLDLSKGYYGEVEYQMEYKNTLGEPFKWLFIDFETLSDYAAESGFKAEKLYTNINNQYLARLTLID